MIRSRLVYRRSAQAPNRRRFWRLVRVALSRPTRSNWRCRRWATASAFRTSGCLRAALPSAAPFGAGLSHSWLGDYLLAFLVAGGLSILAAGLILGLRGARRDFIPALPLEPALSS